MNAQKCLEILRKIKDVSFATVDEKGLPQVRIIDVMIVEDEKLYFCTARGKDFYKQLLNDHHVTISAMNEKYQMVRLSGIAEKLEDLPTAVHQRLPEKARRGLCPRPGNRSGREERPPEGQLPCALRAEPQRPHPRCAGPAGAGRRARRCARGHSLHAQAAGRNVYGQL